MTDRFVSPLPSDDDFEEEVSLRPRRLEAFIGQSGLKRRLAIAIQAAQARGEVLEHVLLSGPPGLGKTTLATIISAEMNGKLVSTSGPAFEKTRDLVGVLTNLKEGDVFFIDEIHRTPRTIEEYLYPAMEDFAVDFMLDKGPSARAIKFSLKRFTLVGATTRAGMLSNPLRDRFGLYFHLDFYDPEELQQIALRSAGVLGVALEPDAAEELARRSRGTPRILNRLLRRVRDFAQVHDRDPIDRPTAAAALALEGVDDLGLDDLDRRVLHTILTRYEGGPVGIEALAATLQQEVDTLTDVVEPYLLQEGFLIRTPGGRRATPKAYHHLRVQLPDRPGPINQPGLFD
ncbi:MAG: Holliday junction branch migration DNA helicase RuvB [Chloroflexi bacterium]|nr:Holliday junction branch migration DNA helicase RuvB [Chloroflexota bacterium]